MVNKLFFGLALIFAVAGCGGGGGGSTTAGITYTGAVTPAAINQTNAQDITLSVINGTDVSSVVGGSANPFMSVNAGDATTSLGAKDISSAVQKLTHLVSQLDLNNLSSSLAATTASVSQAGPCGGAFSGTVNVNDSTGAVSATISFANFKDYDLNSLNACSAGTGSLMNGTLSLSSSSDISTPPPGATLALTFSALTVVGAGNNISMSGAVNLTYLSSTESQISLSMVARNNLSGETLKFENYTLHETDFGSYQTDEISGRFYDSRYGYIDIGTLTPVEMDIGSEWPRAGVVTFTGAAGSMMTVTFGTTSAIGAGIDSQGNSISFEYVYGSI